MVVSGVSSDDECIYNSINGEKVSLSDNDYDKVTIIDEGGNPNRVFVNRSRRLCKCLSLGKQQIYKSCCKQAKNYRCYFINE